MAEQHSSKSIMWAIIIVAAVLIAILFPLTNKSFESAANNNAGADEAELRIQPVARFQLAKVEVAEAGGAPKDGPTVYNSVCGACHNTGAAGAPKIDAKGDWTARLGAGNAALYAAVINGKGAMPPKGGAAKLSEDEVKGAVDYILSKVK
ncbi:c-type cytochrome [Azonexus hydrophilus]|uniref:C-type cytochrome n=1 Tax=Azonexus hydrophilus TaxID=418702 RepID=A0ABZ2XIY7_9RHOO